MDKIDDVLGREVRKAMDSETKGYGDRHLAYHLNEAGMHDELVELANKQQQRIAELERHNELLRDAIEQAKYSHDVKCCPCCTVALGSTHYDDCKYKAAIDAGALPLQQQPE